jgi:hypothetical protein
MSRSESLRSHLDELATNLRGELVRPGDRRWDAARTPWNLTVDQHPTAVAYPVDDDDLRRILDTARSAGLGVTVQPRGHGASGDLADCILVRPSAFDEIEVFPEEQYVRVGAGVLWGTLLPHLDGTGLVPLPGTSPDVSVVGYLLSGGHSWFSRWKGLAANSIRAVEFVDADGASRRLSAADASAGADADLLWALRGGGGLFGIVTALEVDLYPAPSLFGGKLMFPGSAAEDVFEQVRRVLDDAPNELSIFMGMVNMPNAPFVPEALRGQTVASADVVFVGDAAEGSALIQPIREVAPVLLDQTRPFMISQLGEVAAEPDAPMPALDWCATITELGEDGLRAIVEAFREASPAGLSMIQLRPLGGAVAHLDADAHAVVGHLEADYLAFAVAILPGPGQQLDREAVFGPLDRALEGRTEVRAVPSMLPSGSDLASAYPPQILRRLTQIKLTSDPDNVVRSNRPLASVGSEA